MVKGMTKDEVLAEIAKAQDRDAAVIVTLRKQLADVTAYANKLLERLERSEAVAKASGTQGSSTRKAVQHSLENAKSSGSKFNPNFGAALTHDDPLNKRRSR